MAIILVAAEIFSLDQSGTTDRLPSLEMKQSLLAYRCLKDTRR